MTSDALSDQLAKMLAFRESDPDGYAQHVCQTLAEIAGEAGMAVYVSVVMPAPDNAAEAIASAALYSSPGITARQMIRQARRGLDAAARDTGGGRN